MEEEEDTGEVDFDLDEFNVEDEVMSDEDEEVDKTVANSKEQSKPSSQPVKLRLNGTPKLSDRWLTEAPKRRRLLKILPPGKEPETEEKQPSSKSSPSVDASTSPEFQVIQGRSRWLEVD